MPPPDLDKLRDELEQLRKKSSVKERELRRIAEKVGYGRSNRGKEPTWVREPGRPPLTIPGHKGDLKRGTARNIIDRLLDDIDDIQEAEATKEDRDGKGK